jgi:hypothetical protein
MPKWMGSFRVIRMIEPVAVKLDLSENIRCHNLIHASQVRLYRTRDGINQCTSLHCSLMILMALLSGNWSALFTTGLSQFRIATEEL